jgi:hypothetical protein
MPKINYFALLGQPLETPELQAIISDYQLQDEFKDFNKNLEKSWREDGSFTEEQLENLRAQGTFDRPEHKAVFSCIDAETESYAQLRIDLTRKPKLTNPLTTDSIGFYDDFTGEFPCGLSQDTDYETVNLGIKISFEKNPYGGFGKDFLVEGCVVSLYFDDEKQFKSVTLKTLDPHTALLIQFKKDLSAQKTNINANFSAKNLNLPSPVIAWRQRIAGDGVAPGDNIFTEDNLAASQNVLNDFLAEVQTASAKKSPTQLLVAVKNVVKSLNKITKKMSNFIETSEREELVPYIENVVKAAGLQIPQGLDITLEWRDW